MAERIRLVEDFLTCSVCLETFKEPVSLGCSHSFCRSCLQDFWDKNQSRNCPLCRICSKDFMVNFSLRELCDSFVGRVKVSERVKSMTPEQLQSELHRLKAEKLSYEDLEKTYNEMAQFCKKQAVQSERAIRLEFSRLQTFLQEEEQRTLSALREEQLRQTHNMGSELQKVREKLTSLSNSIRELEKHLQTDSYSPQQQSPAPRLRPKAGLLLDQAKVLGNLGFRVWSNMRRVVSYSPVILDPNTASRWLYLSEDLRGLKHGVTQHQNVPDNPERFSNFAEVLGSEGFSSGTHQWDVEVGDHPIWNIGVAKESVGRCEERTISPDYGIWALLQRSGKYSSGSDRALPVQRPVRRLKVKLDYDLGEVSFYDADHMTLLHTYTDTFTEKLFPFFCVAKPADAKTTEVRILPSDGAREEISVEEPSGAGSTGAGSTGTGSTEVKSTGTGSTEVKSTGTGSTEVKSTGTGSTAFKSTEAGSTGAGSTGAGSTGVKSTGAGSTAVKSTGAKGPSSFKSMKLFKR